MDEAVPKCEETRGFGDHSRPSIGGDVSVAGGTCVGHHRSPLCPTRHQSPTGNGTRCGELETVGGGDGGDAEYELQLSLNYALMSF